jgi:hypothetical protein
MFKSKWILVAVLLCVLVPFLAQATATRVIGLGGPNTNYIIKDASNPAIWPQLVQDWPNFAGAEFFYGPWQPVYNSDGDLIDSTRSWDFQKAYLNYSFDANKSVLSVSFDKLPGIRSMFTGEEYMAVPRELDTLVGDASKLSLTYGQPFGDSKVGASISLQQHSGKIKNEGVGYPSAEMSAMLLGINLGFTTMENKLDLAAGIEFLSFKDKYDTVTNKENDGSMALNFAGRYWYQYGDKTALVPNIRFTTMKDAWKADTFGVATTKTDIKLGLGHNWTPVENALAVFEVGVDLTSKKVENKNVHPHSTHKTTFNSLPYWRIGFETSIFSWLNGRLGAERGWVNTTDDNKSMQEPSTAFSQTSTYLGATAHWNRLYLDLVVNPGFLNHGPYFVSGNSSSDLFSRVSLKYDFNK